MKARRVRSVSILGLLLAFLTLLVCVAVLAPAPPSAEAQRKKKKDEQQQEEEEEEEEAEGGIHHLINPAVIAQKTPEGQWEILVKGTAQMPDNLELQVSLHYANATNDPREIQTHIPIKDQAFGLDDSIRFGPYDPKSIASGWYWVVVRFRYSDQSDPEAAEAFRQMPIFSDPEEWRRYVDFSERKAARIGSESVEAREDLERRKHYFDSVEACREILEEFDEALVSALRVGFPGGSAWKDYVKEKNLLREEGKDLERRLDELRKKDKFVQSGKLKTREWREFIDRKPSKEIADHPLKSGGLRGRILRIHHDHQVFKRSKLAGKLPKADGRVDRLTTALYGVTMRWSRVLYKKVGLTPDEVDLRPVDPIVLLHKGTHGEVLNEAAMIEKEVNFHLPKKSR